MDLTDKAIEILLGLLFLSVLGFLCEQEITLRHENSVVTKRLNVELACDKGSTCAQRLSDAAAAGARAVDAARAQAAAEAASAQVSQQEQADDVARQLQAAADSAQQEAATWKSKYAAALKGPNCATWAKQVQACSVK